MQTKVVRRRVGDDDRVIREEDPIMTAIREFQTAYRSLERPAPRTPRVGKWEEVSRRFWAEQETDFF